MPIHGKVDSIFFQYLLVYSGYTFRHIKDITFNIIHSSYRRSGVETVFLRKATTVYYELS